MSWGPLIHGHAPRADQGHCAAARLGTSFGAPSPLEHELGERARARAVDGARALRQLRHRSGDERGARGPRLSPDATGSSSSTGVITVTRTAFLVKAGSGALTLGMPTSPGVPAPVAADTLLARYNDLASVDALLAAHRASSPRSSSSRSPATSAWCRRPTGSLPGPARPLPRSGILLVFDEVISGFRASAGGAQAVFGVQPDLTCLGKIIGGGLPVGAYGGRADVMDMVAPAGPVYQAGTLSGNPVAMTAGLWALKHLTPRLYADLAQRGSLLAAGLADAARDAGVPLQVNAFGSLVTPVLHRNAGPRLRVGACREHRRLCRVLPRHVDAWSLSAAVPVRGVVSVSGSHRRAHQEDDCGRDGSDEGRETAGRVNGV